MDANPPTTPVNQEKYEEDMKSSRPLEEDRALEAFFTYHPPSGDDITHYAAINDAALAFARVVMDHCPSSPDRTVAIRRIREARMDANAAIACKGARLPY